MKDVKKEVSILAIVSIINLILSVIFSILYKNIIINALVVFLLYFNAAMLINKNGNILAKYSQVISSMYNLDPDPGLLIKEYITSQRFYAVSIIILFIVHIFLMINSIIIMKAYSLDNGIINFIYKAFMTLCIYWIPYLINLKIGFSSLSKVVSEFKEIILIKGDINYEKQNKTK